MKDTADKTVKLSFKTFGNWIGQVRKKEMELVFGGAIDVYVDSSTYYTGNIIVIRQILSYKKVVVKISSNTPGYNKTVYLNLPDKVKYTLHRHNLKNSLNAKGVGRLMAGLVDTQIVWTQECGCGYENVLTWDIPIDKPEKLTDGETYIVQTNSLVI